MLWGRPERCGSTNGTSEVEDAKTGGVEPTVSAVVVPMSRKARDMGHPRLDGAIGRQHANGRPGPPAPMKCCCAALRSERVERCQRATNSGIDRTGIDV